MTPLIPTSGTTGDEHYLKAVTDLGNDREIIASCDIYSEKGMKLIGAGLKITGKLYDRLIGQKLLQPLDKALSMDNMLSAEQIYTDAQVLIAANPALAKAADIVGRTYSYKQVITSINLPAALAFRLTICKEKFPRIYQHSLLLMLISVYLASCDDMSLQAREEVAIAALFQDIGLLHIDPKLLEPNYVMTSVERRHLYAHPITSYMLLSEFPELPKTIANAVLEHHEKMNQSGYPRGLSGKKISRYGQTLGLAVLAAKAFDAHHTRIPWKNLDVILKLSSKQYGDNLIGHLTVFREDATSDQPDSIDAESLIEQIKLFARLFDAFNDQYDAQDADPINTFAQDRLTELQLNLFRVGIDPHDPEGLVEMFADYPESMAEFKSILDEMIWQFKSLMLEISRQWPTEVGEAGQLASDKYAWMGEMKLILASY